MSVSCCNKNIFHKNRNKTAPVKNLHASKFIINQPSRVNGWNWPPHPCQLICGMVYLFYIVTMFAILIPLLPSWWLPAGYTCPSVAFFWHLVFYVFAASIDPADENVRTKKYKGSMPAFDCSKRKRVIENRHCSLCDVKVGLKSKHCGRCNKCVAEFDHHCKLLNNCIGGRNYGISEQKLAKTYVVTREIKEMLLEMDSEDDERAHLRQERQVDREAMMRREQMEAEKEAREAGGQRMDAFGRLITDIQQEMHEQISILRDLLRHMAPPAPHNPAPAPLHRSPAVHHRAPATARQCYSPPPSHADSLHRTEEGYESFIVFLFLPPDVGMI